MKIIFLMLTFTFALYAQNHGNDHGGSDNSGNFINEMEVGLELGDGVVEVGHVNILKNTDTSILLLPGSIYLAGHTGHIDTMGYDRFSSFLLNVLNHHASNIHGVQFETGVKLLGFEQQPFGAEPGSSLKFLRLNFTEIDITSVVDLDKEGNKKIHFILAAKLGVSKQNESLAQLTNEELAIAQDMFQCSNCQLDAGNASWGAHQSFGAAIELEYNRLLVKTYAEINRDFSRVGLTGNLQQDLNYSMIEKKVGIEVEYNILDLGRAGHINAFTSVEYYNLNQSLGMGNAAMAPIDKISTDGILFKVGLKYNLGTFGRKKKKPHH